MSSARKRLDEIADQLNNGVAPSRVTVREFLLWFKAERRGYNIVGKIRRALERALH